MKSKVKTKKYRSSDRNFDLINMAIMCVLLVIFIWPLWFVLIASVSNPNEVWNGNVLLLPKGFSLNGYIKTYEYSDIWIGYRNTILYTVVGTIINLFMTTLCAYPLSRKDFVMRGFFSKMFLITMYFSGGLIPNYLLIQNLGMLDTPWALLIPGAISFYNTIIMKTYFQNSIPDSLQEAATLDGANTLQYLLKIVLPLSKPVFAVLALYYGVGHWNNYFGAMIYLDNRDLYPLQLFLREILINNNLSSEILAELDPLELESMLNTAETMKYSIIIVASLPMICLYPLIQKHFVKGVMIGAVKG